MLVRNFLLWVLRKTWLMRRKSALGHVVTWFTLMSVIFVVQSSVRLAWGYDVVIWDEVLLIYAGSGGLLIFGLACLQYALNLEDEVREMARRDPLTGLTRRRVFVEHLDDAPSGGIYVIIDADQFKSVNDTMGHSAGDDVLCGIAALLQGQRSDLVARLGGEEFAMFIRNPTPKTLQELANSLCPGVMLGDRQVTLSIGTAELQSGESPAEALNRADQALYQAKASGRARLCSAENGFFDPRTNTAKLHCESLAKVEKKRRTKFERILMSTGLLHNSTLPQHSKTFLGFFILVNINDSILRYRVKGELDWVEQLILVSINAPPFIILLQAAAAHMVALRQKLDDLANHDCLTGLMNRRRFFREVNQSSEGVLILIDADHFKKVNDTYGHDAGDRCLVALAQHFQSIVRQHDIIARIGGEEFAIFMPGATETDVTTIYERLCSGIVMEPQRHRVTASAGTVRVNSLTPLEPALALADQALYQAKEAGRACVRQAEAA